MKMKITKGNTIDYVLERKKRVFTYFLSARFSQNLHKNGMFKDI